MKKMGLVFSVFIALASSEHAFAKSAHREIAIQVTEKGFVPKQINVKRNTDVTLKVTRMTDNTCAGTIVIADRDIEKELPLNKPIRIPLGKLEKGELRFACGMKMVKGVIVAE